MHAWVREIFGGLCGKGRFAPALRCVRLEMSSFEQKKTIMLVDEKNISCTLDWGKHIM
jgi:hypothetical protein